MRRDSRSLLRDDHIASPDDDQYQFGFRPARPNRDAITGWAGSSPAGSPTTFFDGAIGRFGWLDYGFPTWVYPLAEKGFVVLAVLGVIGLWRSRRELLAVWPMLIGFGVMAVGLMGAIGFAGIRYLTSTGLGFEQARYVFPLLALYAVFIVLVCRAAPRRWAPALGGLLVVLAMAHGLFAELLTVSRYYG